MFDNVIICVFTDVTAVVTMPLTHNSSIPMMEVTNTSVSISFYFNTMNF